MMLSAAEPSEAASRMLLYMRKHINVLDDANQEARWRET